MFYDAMAWSGSYGTHQERKERAAHLRGAAKRAAIAEPVREGTKKRVRCGARKFCLEYQLREGVEEFWFAFENPGWRRGWRRHSHRYETAKQRDQALEAMNRNDVLWEYRPLNLE